MSSNLHELTLSPNARIPEDITYDDWADAYAYNNLFNQDREYDRLSLSIQNNMDINALTSDAIKLTKEAESQYLGPKVTVKEARGIEKKITTPISDFKPLEPKAEPQENKTDAAYQELMDRIYTVANNKRKEDDNAV